MLASGSQAQMDKHNCPEYAESLNPPATGHHGCIWSKLSDMFSSLIIASLMSCVYSTHTQKKHCPFPFRDVSSAKLFQNVINIMIHSTFFFLETIGSNLYTDSEILSKNSNLSGAIGRFTFFTHLAASFLWQQTNVSLSGSDNILYCMYHSQQRHIDSPCRALQVVAF